MQKLLDGKSPAWAEQGEPHLWLPYAQMQTTFQPLPVVKTEGVTITLDGGKTLIDGTSSWWSSCHGYNHPHLVSAVKKQLDVMPHVMFAGLNHEPAAMLAARLAKLTGMPKVFFSDSGSTAVEVALKMAVQYWANQGKKNKTRFVAFHNAYHGDTMGAMSVSDPENGMHNTYSHYMPMQYVVDLPVDEYGFSDFEALLKDNKKSIAGLILEPLVQGAGGMKFHSPDVVAEIYRLCKAHEVLFIADEIATGFGRTGTMFAFEESGITPDILCLGKALTGGMMTLAATLTTQNVFDAFLGAELTKALMHGPTYMANAMACAAANASLDLFERSAYTSATSDSKKEKTFTEGISSAAPQATRGSGNWLTYVNAIEQQMWQGLKDLAGLVHVADVRVKGAIGVVELRDATWKKMFKLRKIFAEKGVWLRPFGSIIYITPAFTISEKDLAALTSAVSDVVTKEYLTL